MLVRRPVLHEGIVLTSVDRSLILAPCFFSAALYGILGMTIRYRGAEFSRIKPRNYLIAFCLADLVAIVIQGAPFVSLPLRLFMLTSEI